MAIHVRTTSVGSVGNRPGGLQVVIAPLVVHPGSTLHAGAALPVSAEGADPFFRRPAPFPSFSREPYDDDEHYAAKIGQRLRDDYRRWQQGGQPSALLQAWWARIKEIGTVGSGHGEPIIGALATAGPQAQVRPQWLADP